MATRLATETSDQCVYGALVAIVARRRARARCVQRHAYIARFAAVDDAVATRWGRGLAVTVGGVVATRRATTIGLQRTKGDREMSATQPTVAALQDIRATIVAVIARGRARTRLPLRNRRIAGFAGLYDPVAAGCRTVNVARGIAARRTTAIRNRRITEVDGRVGTGGIAVGAQQLVGRAGHAVITRSGTGARGAGSDAKVAKFGGVELAIAALRCTIVVCAVVAAVGTGAIVIETIDDRYKPAMGQTALPHQEVIGRHVTVVAANGASAFTARNGNVAKLAHIDLPVSTMVFRGKFDNGSSVIIGRRIAGWPAVRRCGAGIVRNDRVTIGNHHWRIVYAMGAIACDDGGPDKNDEHGELASVTDER